MARTIMGLLLVLTSFMTQAYVDDLRAISLGIDESPEKAIEQLHQTPHLNYATNEFDFVWRSLLLCEAYYMLGRNSEARAILANLNQETLQRHPQAIPYANTCQAQIAYLEADFEKAHKLIEQALTAADKVNELGGIANARLVRSYVYTSEGKYTDALTDLNLAEDIVRSDYMGQAPLVYAPEIAIKLATANVFYYTADYELALQQLDTITDLNELWESARISVMLSRAHYLKALNQPKEVADMAELLKADAMLVENSLFRGYLRNGLARLYNFVRDWQQAEEQARLGLAIFSEIGSEDGIAMAKYLIGEARLSNSIPDDEAALLLLAESLQYFEREGKVKEAAGVYKLRAHHYKETNQFDKASADIERMLELNQQLTETSDKEKLKQLKRDAVETGLFNKPFSETLKTLYERFSVLFSFIAVGVLMGIGLIWLIAKHLKAERKQNEETGIESPEHLIAQAQSNQLPLGVVFLKLPKHCPSESLEFVKRLKSILRSCDQVQTIYVSRLIVYLPYIEEKGLPQEAQRFVELWDQSNTKSPLRHACYQVEPTDSLDCVLAKMDQLLPIKYQRDERLEVAELEY
ncbi:hypothetical protein [Paraferrimonas sedimenticola]|nr:hypothetical protein [Paraferrimonas sedimenticola]